LNPEEVEQNLYLNHSLWWAWAAVMWMGCEVAPKALSTRFLSGMWYLFTLILVSSYTANLAASLTAENLHTPIGSAEDLVNQHIIKYGCLEGGSTCNFFKDAEIGTYYQMWNFMASNPEVFTTSNSVGIERVKESKGGYAFFMESSSIEYIMERDCDLAKVGGEIDSKSYGIGMKKNSPFKGQMNQAILCLQENGVLHKLKNKWWKQKGAKNCMALRNAPKTAKALTLANVSGAFLVLILGMGLATVTAVIEFLWASRKIFSNENSDKCSHLKKEAISSFGRKGQKFNLHKSTSVLSSASDMSTVIERSAIQTHGLSIASPRPRRPTLKKSTNTLNTEGYGTPTPGETKRVLIIIDGNVTSSSSDSDISIESRGGKSSTCEE